MRPKVKICGLKKPADAQYVNDAGADYAGFVFYEKSRRNLSRQQAEEIMKKISPRIKKVAVTVSPDAAQIKTLQQMKFDIIQMHGKLSEDAITAAELPVWYAINLSDPEEFEAKTKSFFELPEELQQKITAIVVDGAGYGGGRVLTGRSSFIWTGRRGFSPEENLSWQEGYMPEMLPKESGCLTRISWM